ncbi:MAG: aldo/keto reductase [Anaerolineae bacterium]|nr:aldo/keto reductase [Anaerolineae bacterium]
MEYRKLGRTDIDVSVIAMGCWAIAGGSTWGPQDKEDAIATIHAALDVGVNFFDTAEGYGDGYSEKLLGEALAGRRHEAVIATKVSSGHLSRDQVQAACERSLRRLGTDYIDLYQIHWPSRTIPLDETMEALEQLQEQGKIRAIGVSNFGVQDLSECLSVGRCETDQLPYSLLWRAIEYEIKPKCEENGIGILCYSPLVQGLLTGKFASADDVPEGRARTRHFSKNRPLTRHGEEGCEEETFAAIERIRQISEEIGQPMARVALAWLLHQSGVVSVLAGARHPEQIRENARAADLKLSSDVLTALTEATEELKQKLGPNPDMWQSESRFR